MAEELVATPETVETPVAVETADTSKPTEEAKTEVEQTPEVEPKKVELTEADKIKAAMQKRIDRLTAKHSNTRKELEELRKLQAATTQTKSGEPKPEDFDTNEEYLIAKGKHEAKTEFEKADAERKQKEQDAASAKTLNEKRKSFEKAEAEIKKTTPDYDEKVQVLNEFISEVDTKSQGFQVFRDILMGSNDLPKLSYHLGKNPELLEKLSEMNVLDMARTLFIEEYKLGQAPKKETSTLPTPIKPLGGSSKASKSLEQMSGKEILKWAKAK